MYTFGGDTAGRLDSPGRGPVGPRPRVSMTITVTRLDALKVSQAWRQPAQLHSFSRHLEDSYYLLGCS
jgi:hypothetical protein